MASITEHFAPKMTALEGAFDKLGRFFQALRAGQAAAHDLDRYNAMSDEALARHGFDRATVSRAVMERHFG